MFFSAGAGADSTLSAKYFITKEDNLSEAGTHRGWSLSCFAP
jgi:hypothetical protein